MLIDSLVGLFMMAYKLLKVERYCHSQTRSSHLTVDHCFIFGEIYKHLLHCMIVPFNSVEREYAVERFFVSGTTVNLNLLPFLLMPYLRYRHLLCDHVVM